MVQLRQKTQKLTCPSPLAWVKSKREKVIGWEVGRPPRAPKVNGTRVDSLEPNRDVAHYPTSPLMWWTGSHFDFRNYGPQK